MQAPAAVSQELQQLFDYGTANESNGVATLVGVVIPHFFPEVSFVEEGCYEVSVDSTPVMLVSPDGGLYPKQEAEQYSNFLSGVSPLIKLPTPKFAVEIKCPYPREFKCPM